MCTATAVKYNNLHIFICLIKTISQRRCCWFIDNTTNIQTCNFTCFFCCLTLCIIKVCRNSNYCFSNCFTKIIFCSLFHLLNDNSGKFLWCILFVINNNTWCIISTLYNFVLHFFNLTCKI